MEQLSVLVCARVLLETWAQVREFLGTMFSEHENSPTDLVVAVPINDRKVAVRLRPIDVQGTPWIEIMVKLAATEAIAPQMAIHMNFELTVGSLCIYRGALCLRQTMPLDLLDSDALGDAVRGIVEQQAIVLAITQKPSSPGAPHEDMY